MTASGTARPGASRAPSRIPFASSLFSRGAADFLDEVEAARHRYEVELHDGRLARALHDGEQRREAGRADAASRVELGGPPLAITHGRIPLCPRGALQASRLEPG